MDKWGSCEEFSLMKVWQFKQQNKNIIILWKAIRTHSHENTWGSSCRGGIRGAGEGRSHRQDPCHRSADLEQWKVLAGTELATASSCGPCGWGLAGLPGPAPQLEAPWGFSQVRCHLWMLRHLLPVSLHLASLVTQEVETLSAMHQNHCPPTTCGKLSSMKSIPGAKKVGDCCIRGYRKGSG